MSSLNEMGEKLTIIPKKSPRVIIYVERSLVLSRIRIWYRTMKKTK